MACIKLLALAASLTVLCIRKTNGDAASTASAVNCASENKVGNGGMCYKVINSKVYWDDAEQVCSDAGMSLAKPRTQMKMKYAWTLAMVKYVADNGGGTPTLDNSPCMGPLWIGLNDRTTDAGSDGTSANWIWDRSTVSDNIAGSDLETFWVDGFPMADISAGGVTVDLDCVATMAIADDKLNLPAGESPPQGMLNLPCSEVFGPGALGALDAFNLTGTPFAGVDLGDFEVPEIPSGKNATLWCPLCESPEPQSSGSSGSTGMLFRLF